MVNAANAVLSKCPHRIANCHVKVKAADLWHQPDFISKLSPDHDSPFHILNALNDDCLHEIFKRLLLPDLTNCSDVCIRFNRLATQIFVSKYKNETVSFHSEFSGRFADAQAMFRNFGPLIQSLSICFTIEVIGHYGTSLRMINQHCSALKELNVSNFRFHGDWKRLCPMFAKLITIKLENCGLTSNHKGLFTACANLKILQLNDCYWIDRCIGQRFPNISQAHFQSNWITASTFVNFITQNPTIRKLTFVGNRMTSTDIVRLISEHLINLQEFEYDEIVHNLKQYQHNILCLSRLHSLKILKLNFNSLSVAPLLGKLVENKIPIEHLKLSKGLIDMDAIQSVSQLNGIKILELSDVYELTDKHIIYLAKELTQMKELHLHKMTSKLTTNGLKTMLKYADKLTFLELNSMHGIYIDTDDYRTILKTIQNRNGLDQLTIEIASDENKVMVPAEILMLNKKWICINEKILYHYFSDDSDYSSDEFDPDLDGNMPLYRDTWNAI